MMQPHGGSSEGWHFPLRKGTEVMVSFQGGDPDRPVIAGVVPNAIQPSNVTARNHTQNVLRTGGNNFLVMDDIDGNQLIEMSTPVDATSYKMGGPTDLKLTIPPWDPAYQDTKQFKFGYHLKTEGDAGFVVGGSWYQWVGRDHFLDVVGETRARSGGRRTLIIGGVSNEFYQSLRNTTISSGRTDKVLAGGMGQEINGGFFQKIAPAGKQEVTGDWFHQVGGENHGKYGGWSTTVDGKWSTTVGGGISMTSTGGNIAINSSSGEVTLIGSTKISLVSPTIDNVTGKWYEFTPMKFELFGTMNAIGVQKFEYAGLAISTASLSVNLPIFKIDGGINLTKGALSLANKGLKFIKASLIGIG